MDLHTTDPGSDLCYVSDWPDDGAKREDNSARIRRHVEREGTLGLPGKDEEIKKDERMVERSLLPAIIRPRSVSLGENLLPGDEDRRKIEQRVRCHRVSRITKHPCTASFINRNVQTKASSLRQQIWMGIPIRNTENGEPVVDNEFRREPLSWGISSLALASYNSKSEILLRSCTEKLRSLDYLERTTKELRKTKKKSRRKQNVNNTDEGKLREKDVQQNALRESKEKFTKKKRSRLKWQMAVNLSSNIKDSNTEKNSFLSVKADSLKLLTANASAKKERRQQKPENREKSHRCNIAATTERILVRNKISKIRTIQKLKSFATPALDSSNSEDGMNARGGGGDIGSRGNDSNNAGKLKNGKRRQKKKKHLTKPSTRNVPGNKKCASCS